MHFGNVFEALWVERYSPRALRILGNFPDDCDEKVKAAIRLEAGTGQSRRLRVLRRLGMTMTECLSTVPSRAWLSIML
jgi:hypothetical protein